MSALRAVIFRAATPISYTARSAGCWPLPESTQLMLCHDYPPAGRTEPAWMCTVAAQRAGNIHVHDGVDEATFVERRLARDRSLDMPTLLLPSVQVNIRAGQLPPAEATVSAISKLPVNAL